MKYILKNKDKDVLEFEVIEQEKHSEFFGKELSSEIANIKILNASILPKNLTPLENLNDSLRDWIQQRKVPKNRALVEEIINSYKVQGQQERLMDYINVSLGLSLNDSYWIVPKDTQYTWKNFNLYENEFSQALALAAFSGGNHKVSGVITSPEYTTNGMLRKCWHRENGRIYLYKSSSTPYANGGKETFSEYYMAQVAQVMGFECVSYDLKQFHNEIVSACPIFTNQDEGFLAMHYCIDADSLKNKNIQLMDSIARVYGKEKFEDLMLFDSLIYNTDRHLGNFGMIVDNNTQELLRPAPIFDNGLCVFNIVMESELANIQEAMEKKTPYFDRFSFDEQLEFFTKERHLEGLEKLSKFSFIRHPQFNLSDVWLESIQKHLNKRASQAIEYIKEKGKTQTKQQVNKKTKQPAKKDNLRSR